MASQRPRYQAQYQKWRRAFDGDHRAIKRKADLKIVALLRAHRDDNRQRRDQENTLAAAIETTDARSHLQTLLQRLADPS